MPDKLSLLKRYWGHESFRPLQEEIIDSILEGRDTMVLLPTGGGKSLCYQLPALMTEGLCLVVSPLIALMKDQVQQLNDRHIMVESGGRRQAARAACIVSGMGRETVMSVLANCMSGTVKFLYVSPERLRQRLFIEHFRMMKVSLIAVDEAHCVSQWGYDFRPPYLQIADLRPYHPQAPLVALTATATPMVADDIKRRLAMRSPRHFQSSFARPNLSYTVVCSDNKIQRMVQTLKSTEGSCIVYIRSRRAVQQVADQLTAEGIGAAYYHAGLDAAERDRRQALWMQDKCRVMVATNAFGMGIDKADVRLVIHLDVPDSLEAYFQEAGRAGRDGRPATALLLWSTSDASRLDREVEVQYPPLKYIRNVYRALCNYYKLPMGSGADSRFDFDMEAVCRNYSFAVREFYSACRFLEREGLVTIPERDEACSTLYVPAQRDELYRFQVEHLRLGNMMQSLMRLYPGLLTTAVPINERKIASRCGLDVAEVVSQLKELQALKVVDYNPKPLMQQIVFPTARIDEREICLAEQMYDELKQTAYQRLAAVKAYLADDSRCRSRQLLAYFGETQGVADCGRCDVCARAVGADQARQAVREALQHGALSPQTLQSVLEAKGCKDVAGMLRGMLDRGELYLDGNMLLNVL